MTQAIPTDFIHVFAMTGQDVLAFLNNQTVTDLKPDNNQPLFTAICNPKGRVLFSMVIHHTKDTTWVAVDASLGDTFLQYINMRKFRMDVNLKISADRMVLKDHTESTAFADLVEFSADPEITTLNPDDVWLWMFGRGLPWITKETTEQFIPQHLNLDQNGTIDFDKGCYPGQEIVARLHFLGSIKKRMRVVQYTQTTAFEPLQKTELDQIAGIAEVCAPSVQKSGQWHTQVIAPV